MNLEEMQEAIDKSKREREEELMRRVQEICKELQVDLLAVITSYGASAVATITARAK